MFVPQPAVPPLPSIRLSIRPSDRPKLGWKSLSIQGIILRLLLPLPIARHADMQPAIALSFPLFKELGDITDGVLFASILCSGNADFTGAENAKQIKGFEGSESDIHSTHVEGFASCI